MSEADRAGWRAIVYLLMAVKNALSRLYGYDSDNLLLATWTGA